ncbi:dTDP-4-dehydrorhamnose reductase [Pusillimonas sp.]|uniref:dTDP-4-dehydrorhamnose reductase n=1 Tax=Pusillimonas sp. TaxID=3040095 RepID=UPI0029B7F306|nr:dTDP-4-dehydrorhamnose reductase [Pusillimonas sp.]MDX3895149.1 dTDP-4-dehydrorhamnose reductase [Pusillimonas sp.]
MNLKILITGAQGQLGRTLQQLSPPHWAVTALGSGQLDITDAKAVREQVKALRPDLVINAAAYNAVDRAEQERERAFAVNAQGPLSLARAANEAGARLVHVSTDYVFDGRSDRPYGEQAAPNPLNAYGESKLQGEQRVLREQPQALVVRTAWVYSALGRNFVVAMLRAAGQGLPVRVVDDQTGAPTFAGDLAEAIIGLAGLFNAEEGVRPEGGIYHYSGATALTRYDFARAIFEAADRIRAGALAAADRRHAADLEMADGQPGSYLKLLSPIASRDYPSAAIRPRYSVLDCGKMAALGFGPRPLEDSLPAVVRTLLTKR